VLALPFDSTALLRAAAVLDRGGIRTRARLGLALALAEPVQVDDVAHADAEDSALSDRSGRAAALGPGSRRVRPFDRALRRRPHAVAALASRPRPQARISADPRDGGPALSGGLLEMRIAQVAPLCESVPPRLYGGTERVVSYLTEELVRAGHDVTLFASADSSTAAHLVPCCGEALRFAGVEDPTAPHVVMLERLIERADAFDVVHFHIDWVHLPFARRMATPSLTTLHGRLDLPQLAGVFAEFTDMPFVSISDAQREPLTAVNWLATVYHGLPADAYPPRPDPDDYVAFIGRISPEKRVDRAIEIARRAGMKIKIAAKVADSDREYHEKEIAPLLEQPGVEWLGEVGEADKAAFLGGARALLFPIDWPEPFGLVMIESFACGTPVIAFRRGSVAEVVDDGITGFVVDDVDAGAAALARIDELDRLRVRAMFERRFSAERMASDYIELYARVAEQRVRSRTGEWPQAVA
jgi:glycosyltransferase involved in cell wall biosynthesis